MRINIIPSSQFCVADQGGASEEERLLEQAGLILQSTRSIYYCDQWIFGSGDKLAQFVDETGNQVI